MSLKILFVMQWSVAEKEMWGSNFTQFVGLSHPAAERMEQNVIWPTRMRKLSAIYTLYRSFIFQIVSRI
jgi:hypothetical protein